MFSKLIKKVFKETTNIADITPATFNATGIYNPRYGKQKIYVTGQGGTGTYTPGNPYDNSYTNSGTYTPGSPYDNSYTNSGTYTPGNPFNNSYTNLGTYTPGNPFDNSYTNSGTYTPGSPYDNSYTNSGTYTPGNPFDNSYTNSPVVVAPLLGVKVGTNYYTYGTYWVNYTTLSPNTVGQYYNGRQDLAGGTNLYNNYAATPYSTPFVPQTYIVLTGAVPPSYSVFPFSQTNADVYGNVPGSTTPGNYVAGNTGVYAGTYTPGNYVAGNTGVYAGTYTSGNYVAGNTGVYAGTYTSGNYVAGNTGVYAGTYTSGNYVAGNTGVYAGTYTSGNYVAGNTGVYAGTYTPGNYVAGNSGTYSATVNAGSSTNVFGVTLPGGYGGSASIVPLTIAIPVTTYGTSPGSTYSTSPISITVPSGGYVTITFTL